MSVELTRTQIRYEKAMRARGVMGELLESMYRSNPSATLFLVQTATARIAHLEEELEEQKQELTASIMTQGRAQAETEKVRSDWR